MSKDSRFDHNNSLYPEQDVEEVDDNSWQISYLDIVTILLGFLIIMLSTSNFTENNFFSVSSLFKSDVQEARYITTPINRIQDQLEEVLSEQLVSDKISIERDLNDLLIQLNSDSLYLSGSATIQPESLNLLNSISQAIQGIEYDDFNIEVEGHTDDVPINSAAYPSNWELSTARATNMVKFLVGMGISKEHLKASGYADSRPIVSNVNATGAPIPENRAKNRRVTLRLFYDKPTPETGPKKKEGKATFDERCRYSIQLGGFKSFGNALNGATNAVKVHAMDVNITYNGQLFSVRSAPKKDLNRTLNLYRNLGNTDPQRNFGIIHQCYSNENEAPTPLEFRIQLGAFNSEKNARSLSSSLKINHDIPTEVSDSKDGVFRVVSNPKTSLKQTMEQARYLKNITGDNNLISYSNLESTPYSFDFSIQIGAFSSQDMANEYSQNISSLMGITSTIEKANEGTYLLISEPLADWPATLQTFSDLSNTSYDLEPVIYLIEENTAK